MWESEGEGVRARESGYPSSVVYGHVKIRERRRTHHQMMGSSGREMGGKRQRGRQPGVSRLTLAGVSPSPATKPGNQQQKDERRESSSP